MEFCVYYTMPNFYQSSKKINQELIYTYAGTFKCN
jgi:hypothetical protein